MFYEEFAHRRLLMGGRFEYRELGVTSRMEVMDMAESQLHMFDKIEEVDALCFDIYARPRHRNFPAVDALLKVSWSC